MIAIGCHEHEYGWLVERAGCDISTGFKAIKFVDDTGKIHGMVGYGNWTANAVVLTIALDNPAALREVLKWGFRYPFEQCGRGIALAVVRGKNKRSLSLCNKVGFREVYRVKDGIDVGEDMIFFQMRREECRWIPKEARKVA
jgi:RimJ/RimL family protein N-acetyltransferase